MYIFLLFQEHGRNFIIYLFYAFEGKIIITS